MINININRTMQMIYEKPKVEVSPCLWIYLLWCLKNLFLFEGCSVSSLSHLWTEIPFLVLYWKWKQNPPLDKRKKNGLWPCPFWFTGCAGTLCITLSHLFNFPKGCIPEPAGDLPLAGIQIHFFTSSFHISRYAGGWSFAST